MSVPPIIHGQRLPRVVPQSTNRFESETILGYKIARGSKETCAGKVVDWLDETTGPPKYLACANPHSFVIGSRDDLFRAALMDADLLIPDGVGIVVASRILGGKIRERVTGSDLFQAVNVLANQTGPVRYFFVGSSRLILDRIIHRLSVDFPRIEIAGSHAPPFVGEFTDAHDDEIATAVNLVRTDVLWVGMGAPKQEKWIHRNRQRLKVKFIGAVGAVFDFYACAKQRSPQWALRTGLEWLPRLLREPSRLGERTFVSAPIFLWLVLRERMRRQSKVPPESG